MAFEKLNDGDISHAINELIGSLGVKEEESFQSLFSMLEKKDVEGCSQQIAEALDLPVRINLTYVPKDFRLGNGERFRTGSLSRTDKAGRGIEGITAQVFIPPSLPLFGTLALKGYPIQVRVSEDCHAYPATFISIMAHELSHVLLASLRHPMRDSELHTDLVPILMGFSDVVRDGRKIVESTTNGNVRTTSTIRYGYLTDPQFDFAHRHVTDIIARHRRDRKNLLATIKRLQRNLKTAQEGLSAFRDYFGYLDKHPPKKMKQDHAQRIVNLHGRDYSIEWEECLMEAEKSIEAAKTFADPLRHYKSSTVAGLNTHAQSLKETSCRLLEITTSILREKRMLRKYVGIIYRCRRTLGSHH